MEKAKERKYKTEKEKEQVRKRETERERAHPQALNNLENQREDKTKEQEKNTGILTQWNNYTRNITDMLFLCVCVCVCIEDITSSHIQQLSLSSEEQDNSVLLSLPVFFHLCSSVFFLLIPSFQ